jgi:hypothetical protein
MVQRSIAGWPPPLAAAETVNATLEPGVVVAELSDSATCCAKVWLTVKTSNPLHSKGFPKYLATRKLRKKNSVKQSPEVAIHKNRP